MGSLALAMVGVVSLAPVLANVLRPVVEPVYTFLGADPAMFATTLLANDMGGYPLAMQLAQTNEAGLFAGLILGAMMGPTIVFTIPVALGIIDKEDTPFLAKGVLAGIITIPLGCLVGGLVAGFDIVMILKNLVPIILFAGLISLGLWKIPNKMISGFINFGKGVVVLITLALAAIIIETLTGVVIIPGMAPISEGITIIGSIAMTLAGCIPTRILHYKSVQQATHENGYASWHERRSRQLVWLLRLQITFQCSKCLKTWTKEVRLSTWHLQFLQPSYSVDHLGFTAGVNKEMIFPMVVGKLVGGITAVILASLMMKKAASATTDNSDKKLA